MQRTSRHVIAWGLLFSLLLTSQVGAASPATAMASKYEYYYQGFQAGEYWVTVTKMNGIAVPNGLGIFNKDTGGNLNIVSETMGYAMILAALYDDQDTFDKLSATVQVGIRSGLTPTNIETKLLPWTWTQSSTAGTFALKSGASSASDADINIALAYIYADNASAVYGWPTKPTQGSTLTYNQMATNYIQAIRTRDFASSASNTANKYILTDGSDQAAAGDIYSWHPDYSDIRAYQLFANYDTSYANFWQSAITYTKAAWKAVFDFGSDDPRTTWKSQPTSTIQSSLYNVWLSNATYAGLTFSSNYSSVSASRTASVYDTDCSRMPIRLMNYVNALENYDSSMSGIANSILSALGSTYLGNSYHLTNQINIWSPFVQNGKVTTQNYTAAGLLALAGDSTLPYSNRQTVETNLLTQFSSGTIATDFGSTDGFNDSLTLWGLTVYVEGNTPLQAYTAAKVTGATSNTGGYLLTQFRRAFRFYSAPRTRPTTPKPKRIVF